MSSLQSKSSTSVLDVSTSPATIRSQNINNESRSFVDSDKLDEATKALKQMQEEFTLYRKEKNDNER